MYVLHDLSEIIGHGSFGTVYRDGKYAIKVFSSHKHGDIERESNLILLKLKAPSNLFLVGEWLQIIKIKGMIYPGIKMPCMHSNAYSESVKPRYHGLAYITKLFDPVMKAVVEAVLFLSNHGYAHGDVKLSNVLIRFDKVGALEIQLSDYSFLCKIGTRHECFPLSQFCMYRHFTQFSLTNGVPGVYITNEEQERWSLAMCIVDLARQGVACSCNCTDNKLNFDLHQQTAVKFRNAKNRLQHIENVLNEFKTRQTKLQTSKSDVIKINEICERYKQNAMNLCV